jgi:hypothetical protein
VAPLLQRHHRVGGCRGGRPKPKERRFPESKDGRSAKRGWRATAESKADRRGKARPKPEPDEAGVPTRGGKSEDKRGRPATGE